jgi:riboflavin kinase / FMN adenylyltransferase
MIQSVNIADFQHTKPVVTIGFFDGIHLGHKEIISTVVSTAKRLNRKSLIITFWPHPRIVLSNDFENLRFLTTLNEKAKIIESMGVDGLLVVEFTKEFASTPAVDFVEKTLINQLQVSGIVLGYNHSFGYRGLGNFNLIKQHQAEGNYEAIQVESISIDGVNVSSTKIREALESGNLSSANQMLGAHYSLTGTIEGGQQIGRSIGFPTANIKPVESLKQVPYDGVYAVWVDINGESFPAMLNVGTRPTLGNGLSRTIEAHIIGFEQNIYNKEISVRFVERIRDEHKFATLNELKSQLQVDREHTISILGVSQKEIL